MKNVCLICNENKEKGVVKNWQKVVKNKFFYNSFFFKLNNICKSLNSIDITKNMLIVFSILENSIELY